MMAKAIIPILKDFKQQINNTNDRLNRQYRMMTRAHDRYNRLFRQTHKTFQIHDLPTVDFVETTTDQDEDVSILQEDNSQIYAHLNNVLVHMIDNQQTAIFKSNQDFNKNKEKISQYIKYTENWQVTMI